MAWTYLVESVVSRLRSGLGYELSHIAKTTDTLKASYCHECGQETLIMPPSRMTCDGCGASRWWGSRSTLFPEGSPARTSALRELERAWKESEADWFATSLDLSGSYDRSSSSWKTCPPFAQEALTLLPESFPRLGMIVDGSLYLRWKSGPVIDANAGSSWQWQEMEEIPTPTASEYGSSNNGTRDGVRQYKTKRKASLSTMARKGVIPTPMARDWKGSGGDRNSPDLAYMAGGPLNPAFIEEIMGYKIGWTVCEDWVMPWFRPKREKRSVASPE